MLLSPAGEWSTCGERFYHKKEIYSNIAETAQAQASMPKPLCEYRVAASRFGGPLAFVRDDTQVLQVGRVYDANQTVCITSANGKVLGRFSWRENVSERTVGISRSVRKRGRLVDFGWTSSLLLLCVDDKGSVFQYDVHGKLLHSHFNALSSERDLQSLNELEEDLETNSEDKFLVTDCCFWNEGIVVYAVQRKDREVKHLFSLLVSNKDGTGFLQMEELACPGAEAGEYQSMTVAEPLTSVSGQLEVILAVGDTVYVVSGNSIEDQKIDKGPFWHLSLCPNGQLIAAYSEDGMLLVMSSDFQQFLTEFQTNREEEPDQVIWCGVDSVLLRYEETLVMVGPYGDWVKYTYDDSVVLIPECDGVRVLSDNVVEFLYRVPDCMVDIYKPGSTTPAALLYDARQHFDNQTAKADENLRAIGADLQQAIEACIEAAGYTFDVGEQKQLLRAASYGHIFCDTFSKERFKEVCESIRVLNNVRDSTFGIPLTYQQYMALTPQVLVSRLANSHYHMLACRVAKYNNIGIEKVLHHWAKLKILNGDRLNDQEICEAIVSKLKMSRDTSFAQIAAYAFSRNRKHLAALLLEYETRAGQQVPLLLEIGEMQRALDKAIDTGDADLVYYTLFYIKQRTPLQDFLTLVNHRPQARNLFMSYCKKTDSDAYKAVLQSMGNHEGIASATLSEVLSTNQPDQCQHDQSKFSGLISGLDRVADLYGHTREHAFESKACAEFSKLLKAQRRMQDNASNTHYLGLSVADSMSQCILLGNTRALNQLKSDFKITDKQFWHLKIRTLSTSQDWRALGDFAAEKRSPIGYLPFFESARKQGAPKATLAQFIARITDPKVRAEKYADIGLVHEASEAATLAKDADLISRIKGMGMNYTSTAIDQIRGKLGKTSIS